MLVDATLPGRAEVDAVEDDILRDSKMVWNQRSYADGRSGNARIGVCARRARRSFSGNAVVWCWSRPQETRATLLNANFCCFLHPTQATTNDAYYFLCLGHMSPGGAASELPCRVECHSVAVADDDRQAEQFGSLRKGRNNRCGCVRSARCFRAEDLQGPSLPTNLPSPT